MSLFVAILAVALAIYFVLSIEKWEKHRETKKKEKLAKAHLGALTKKYGSETAKKLFNQDFWIGMTKQQVIDCMGKPIAGIKEHNSKGVTDKWTFEGAIVHFKADKAIKIIEDPNRPKARLVT